MKYSMVFAAAAATTVSAGNTGKCNEEGGNFFCSAVKALQYDGLNVAGSYKAVTSMTKDGGCTFADVPFSGPIAPFDEDLSIHFRGPATIEKVAVYTPKANSKRDAPKPHSKRHGHQHLHKKFNHEHSHEERAVGDTVHAKINGQDVSWTNTWDGKGVASPEGAAPAAAPAAKAAADIDISSSKFVKSEKIASAPKAGSSYPAASSPQKTDTSSVPTGDYARIGYYDALSGQADGITFLGNLGGGGSGVFDDKWGNSLSYISEDGTKCAASPTVLKNGIVPDATEIAIFSDKPCTDKDATCGYYRPGTVAYEGFKGADKVFTFRLTMPDNGETGWNKNMPACWVLNGKIPRTGQYHDCSCWKSGCGEFDVLEVLASGDDKCKSTFHYTNSIGNSDFIKRPTLGFANYALIFSKAHASASVKVLPDDFNHAVSLTSDQVEAMIADDTKNPGSVSKMAIPV
ncbi:TOS1-like glycosyl hydrolase-domain-containing protein [Apiospora saccharicola]|uniref:glucan endo-1,3-beta-D-glucosidase n=1 Tax=Apiospora saccharicola TaxID=335842 RepID=A0ABR1VMD5_9PEZI